MLNQQNEIFYWCEETLHKMGYILLDKIIPVRAMPWSQVYKVKTDRCDLYLKHQTKPFAAELNVLKFLGGCYSNFVPKLVASHHEKLYILLIDSGEPLRNELKLSYNANLPARILKQYAKIQIDLCRNVQELIDLDIPDWRLMQMPSIYEEMLTWKKLLINDGLTKAEYNLLAELKTSFNSVCQNLSEFNIPESIEHCDFHDNNLLIKNDHIVISDWGDTVITHPFFSIITFLLSACRNHNISENNDVYKRLKSTYLDEWQEFESKERLLQAFDLVKLINPIKYVVSFYRISLCPGMENFGEYRGVISESLVNFINDIQGYKG